MADGNGVGFDPGDLLVFRKSWVGEGRPIGEQSGQVMLNAVRFASSLRATAYRVNAFDIRLEDARRAACAGFTVRSVPEFAPQLEGRFSVPVTDSPPRDMAAGRVSADEE